MRLRFTPRAARDLIDIADYIHTQNPTAALRVRSSILDSFELLILFPEIGRRQSIEGVRKLVTRRYPYLIYYTLDMATEEIVILTIQHPARDREYSDN